MAKITKGTTALSAVLLSAALLGAEGVSGNASPDHRHHHAPPAEAGEAASVYHQAMLANLKLSLPSSVHVDLRDLELVTQDGDRVKFVSDVIGDRIVVMNFIYTDCTTVCPAQSALFSLLQDALGDRVGRDVVLVSLTVNPTIDTPQRLKAYAQRHRARPGWEWLTGNPEAVDQVLHGMGAYATGADQQPAMVLVGDGRSHEWTRFFGFPGTDQLLAHVDGLTNARGAIASNTPLRK